MVKRKESLFSPFYCLKGGWEYFNTCPQKTPRRETVKHPITHTPEKEGKEGG